MGRPRPAIAVAAGIAPCLNPYAKPCRSVTVQRAIPRLTAGCANARARPPATVTNPSITTDCPSSGVRSSVAAAPNAAIRIVGAQSKRSTNRPRRDDASADIPKNAPTMSPIPASAIPRESESCTASAPGRKPGRIATVIVRIEATITRQRRPDSCRPADLLGALTAGSPRGLVRIDLGHVSWTFRLAGG